MNAAPHFCRKCGQPLSPSDRFCLACGTVVQSAAAPAPGVAPGSIEPTHFVPQSNPPTPAYPFTYEAPPAEYAPPFQPPLETPVYKRPVVWAAACGVMALLCLVVVILGSGLLARRVQTGQAPTSTIIGSASPTATGPTLTPSEGGGIFDIFGGDTTGTPGGGIFDLFGPEITNTGTPGTPAGGNPFDLFGPEITNTGTPGTPADDDIFDLFGP